MKNVLLLLLTLLTFGNSSAQKYVFLPASFQPINREQFAAFANRDAKPQIIHYLENGKTYDQAYQDSIYKSKESHRLTQSYFIDTLQNTIAVVLRKRSKEETDALNKQFYKYQKDYKKANKKLVGTSLSHWKLQDINGLEIDFSKLQGKMIFVNFWFTKCAPCIKEMPELNRIKQTYGTDKVAYIAITYDNKKLVETFLQNTKLDFSVIADRKDLISELGVEFFPTNMLIDENGKIVYINDPFKLNSHFGLEEIEKRIKKHTNL